MMYSCKSRFDVDKSAPPYVHELMNQLRNELKNVEVATKTIGGGTVVIAGSATTSVSSSSGSSSSSASTVKSGTQFVTANTNTWVSFPITFGSIPIVLCFVSGADNSFGFYNSSKLSVTKTGFSIPASEIMISGQITYIAQAN